MIKGSVVASQDVYSPSWKSGRSQLGQPGIKLPGKMGIEYQQANKQSNK